MKGILAKASVRIDYDAPAAAADLAEAIRLRLRLRPPGSDVVILCIGTDRSTGDALGPLVGSALMDRLPGVMVHGTLDQPVHAVNLRETVDRIALESEKPFVMAIDACLGQVCNVGQITVGEGALRPGAGVHKDLPPVGDAHITGIVNVGGFMEYFVLQNTRLSMVYKMAGVISEGLCEALKRMDLSGVQAPRPFQGRLNVLFRGR